MQKNIIIGFLIIILGLIFLNLYVLSLKNNIAYIDLNVLLNEYKGMTDVNEVIEKRTLQWEAEIDSIIKVWENQLKLYEKERSNMTKKERKINEELLKNKQTQIQNYKESITQKASTEKQQLQQKMFDEINHFIKEFGELKGYDIILGANGTGNILYGAENKDITKEVIEELNSIYDSKTNK